jgi:hypothetical protein
MKKPLETLGGLLVLAGAAGLAHQVVGWALFGVVVRVTRATPFVRDHQIATYVALIVLGLAVLVAADAAADADDATDPRPVDEAEHPDES